MAKYISLLRGINVSGQKKILMADLKVLYESLDYLNVLTYIQSGNVIFDIDTDDIKNIINNIEAAIENQYGFHVPVDVRTAGEFQTIFTNLPFKDIDIEKDGTKFMVMFLMDTPSQQNIELLAKYVIEPEQLILKGNVIYLHCPNGYGRTKLSNGMIEKKLAVKSTARNLKSVAKLCQLAKG